VTLRIAHVMAGAAMGGAAAFYERPGRAQHAAGEEVLAVIRQEAGRAARLRDGGLRPVELPMGGYFDLVTRPRLGRVLAGFGPRVVVAWANRAGRYAGVVKRRGAPWTLVGRLGGYYDLKYYRHCDHLVGNTRDLRDWIIGQGWPAARSRARRPGSRRVPASTSSPAAARAGTSRSKKASAPPSAAQPITCASLTRPAPPRRQRWRRRGPRATAPAAPTRRGAG
jgi:hypothetical protein